MRAKNMMYVQTLEHLAFKDFNDLMNHIQNVIQPEKFAGIIHDKDIDAEGNLTDTHVHVIMQFKNARSIQNIATLLKDEPQYIEHWRNKAYNGYSYLIHATDKSADKYQYDATDVFANFDFLAYLEQVKETLEKQKTLKKKKDNNLINDYLDLLYNDEITKQEIEEKLTGSQYAKAHKKIEDVDKKRAEIKAKKWKQSRVDSQQAVNVIWLYGEAGTGKTALAKYFSQQSHEEFYITGSNKDPFQKYDYQPIIIFDDLRPETFSYNTLLKMFDPYSEEIMGESRYYDKTLTAHTFIITTPYNPKIFYDNISHKNKSIDSFKQLYRRVDLVTHVTSTYLIQEKYDSNQRRFKSVKKEVNPLPFLLKKQKENINNADKLFTALSSIDNTKEYRAD